MELMMELVSKGAGKGSELAVSPLCFGKEALTTVSGSLWMFWATTKDTRAKLLFPSKK